MPGRDLWPVSTRGPLSVWVCGGSPRISAGPRLTITTNTTVQTATPTPHAHAGEVGDSRCAGDRADNEAGSGVHTNGKHG